MSAKPSIRRSPKPQSRNALVLELEQLVSTHVARCLQDAMELLERRGYLAKSTTTRSHADTLPAARSATRSHGFAPDSTCMTVPVELEAVLAAARQPDAPTLTEAQARAGIARNRLLAALEQRQMNQAELARLVKKSPAVVSRILRNPEKCRIATLRRIADALGVDVGDVLADR